MNSDGLEKIKQAFAEQDIFEDRIEIAPIPLEIPQAGVRFLGVSTLDGLRDRDVMAVLRHAGLTPDKAKEKNDLRLAHLHTSLDEQGQTKRILLEDITLHGDDSFDQLAREIYGVCRIDILDLQMRQYNVLTRAQVETVGELLELTPEQLIKRGDSFFRADDIERIDEALVPFRLWVGYDHETPPY